MEKLKSTAVFLVAGYTITAMLIFAPYYNWTYARDNGFIKWLFLGEVSATAKAIVWPYFAFFNNMRKVGSDSINVDPPTRESKENG